MNDSTLGLLHIVALPFALLPVACAGPLGTMLESEDAAGGAGGAAGAGTGGELFDSPIGSPESSAPLEPWNPPAPDPVVSISPESDHETDSTIVAFDKTVVVAWKAVTASGDSFIGYAFSTDGGLTFLPPSSIPSVGGRSAGSPTLIRGVSGHHLAWLGYRRTASGDVEDTRVYLARAEQGQTTFGPPVEVNDPADTTTLYDNPRLELTVDLRPIVTYAYAGPAGQGLMAALSSDQGASFTRSTIVHDPTSKIKRDFASVGVHSGYLGKVYVAYIEHDTTTGHTSVRLQWSDNHGETWDPAATALVSQPGVDVVAAPLGMIFNMSLSPPPNDFKFVTILYGHGLSAPGAAPEFLDLRLARSGDGGKTFPQNTSVFDAAATGLRAMRPLLFGGPASNMSGMHLVYHAGKEGDVMSGKYFWAHNPTWGSWFPPPKVIKQSLTYQQSRTDSRWIGDNGGGSGGKDRFFTSYADNSSGASHIAVFRVGPELL